VRRRDLLARAAGAAALWPFAASAQSAKIPTIGVLVVGVPGSERFWRLFRDDMRGLGYVEGTTIRYEFRSDDGQSSRLPELAAELVQLKVAAIVAWYTPAAIAAKAATHDLPIVMAQVGDPVGTGLVQSLARPGGNVTGMAAIGGQAASKTLQLLRELLPSAYRVATLVNDEPFSKPFLEQIRQAGAATGTAIEPVPIPSPDEIDAAFATLERDRPDALMVLPSLPIRRIAQLALQHRYPTGSPFRSFVDVGGLLSYSLADAPLYRRAAAILDKVLKGANPADIPVERPTTFELVINLKTANALGLTVPPALLARADEVIE